MKTTFPPQAGLQRKVLFALAVGPAPSIVALAELVGSTRPAVSRSLKSLAGREQVQSEGRTWSITAAGRTAIRSRPSPHTIGALREWANQAAINQAAGVSLARMARAQVEAANLVAGPDTSKLFGALDTAKLFAGPDTSKRFGALDTAKLFAGPDTSKLFGALDTAKLFAGPDTSKLFGALDSLGKARMSANSSLTMQLDALVAPPAWWTSTIADNLGLTSRIAADVAALTDAAVDRFVNAPVLGISKSVAQVVRRHEELLKASMDRIIPGPPAPDILSSILSPTSTTAAFTGTARSMVLAKTATPEPTSVHHDAVGDLSERLDALGARASARDLRDAWELLRQRSPGWEKTVPHLMREALREALDGLAPPAEVPRDEKGFVTKRAQVSWIVGDDATLVVWIEVTSTNVGKLHSMLSAEAKNDGDPRVGWQGLLGLLETTMGLLRILADRAGRRPGISRE